MPAVNSEDALTANTDPASPPPSSFLHALQTTAWLPSSLGGVQNPSALFYPDSHILALLGEHVPYLACPIKDPSLLTALGVITEVTWRDVLRMLSTWAQRPLFKSSVEHMDRIYSFLATAMEREPRAAESICSAFAQSPLIWLPDKAPLVDVSNTAAVATPTMRGASLVPYDMTPQPRSSQRRKKGGNRRVAFATPATQARQLHTDTPAAPAYTPYTVTPGWTPLVAQRLNLGHFHAASGDTLRLWDSTGVLESIPAQKLSIRILSAVYASEAVMHFFAEGLVWDRPPQASPICQFQGLDGKRDTSVSPSRAEKMPDVSQAQRQQQLQPLLSPIPEQQSPVKSQPATAGQRAVRPRPARAALGEYIDLMSSDDEAAMPAADQDLLSPTKAAATDAAVDTDMAQQSSSPAGPTDTSAANDLPSHIGSAEAAAAHAQAAQPEPSPQAPQSPMSPPSESPAAEPQSLILGEPTCKDYCQALAVLAEPLPPALYPKHVAQVLAIMNRWSGMVADGTLEEEELTQLQEMLKGVKAFPIAGQQWVSLSDGLVLNDDPSLARLFEGAAGVALLQLPTPDRYKPLLVLLRLQSVLPLAVICCSGHATPQHRST